MSENLKMPHSLLWGDSLLFGSCETLLSTDTFHVKDYSKIVADTLEASTDRKRKHQQEVFPSDCQKAFEMGSRFVKEKGK
jgi:hypothetical protein